MKLINYFLIAINIYLLTYFFQFVFNFDIINLFNFEKFDLTGIVFLSYFLIALLVNPILFLTNVIFVFFRKNIKSFLSVRTNKIIFFVSILLSVSNIIFTIITIATLDEL